MSEPVTLTLPISKVTPLLADRLATILEAHPGPVPVYLHLTRRHRGEGQPVPTVLLLGPTVTRSPELGRDLTRAGFTHNVPPLRAL